MSINKVIFGSDTIMDISDTTAAENKVLSGEVFYNAAGTRSTGSLIPVTSVNGETGDVVLDKGDIGLGNVDNVQQYSASNPPPYPVTSVNGKTGAVTVVEDDQTWGGWELPPTTANVAADVYIPSARRNFTESYFAIATSSPTNYRIAKYDGNAYLKSTTPASSDNSTKVATTAYVDNAIPTKVSDLTNDSAFVDATGAAAAAPVQSVNGSTGAVTITASSLGIPEPYNATTLYTGSITTPIANGTVMTLSDAATNYKLLVMQAFNGTPGSSTRMVIFDTPFITSAHGIVGAGGNGTMGSLYVQRDSATTYLFINSTFSTLYIAAVYGIK